MAKQKKSKFVNFVTWLLLLLLLLGGIGVILHFAGIGKDDISDMVNPTFRVEYDGNAYKTDTENIVSISQGGQARFEVKNSGGFTVEVVPNLTAETDFSYSVNGQTHMFSEENDLSGVFGLQVFDGAFTVNFDNATSIESVLSTIWGTEDITVGERGSFPLYKITVVSSRGETVNIFLYYGITKIELPESIIL